MASHEKPDNKTGNNTGGTNPAVVITEAVPLTAQDKEKIKRHNMQQHKDMELSALLQAKWARRVEIEHRPN